MKLLVTGSRTIQSAHAIEFVNTVLDKLHASSPVTVLISGNAQGIDRIAEEWADARKIPIETFIPAWHIYGRGAGVVRNAEMIETADKVIAFWNGTSKGTRNAIDIAIRKDKLLSTHFVQTVMSRSTAPRPSRPPSAK